MNIKLLIIAIFCGFFSLAQYETGEHITIYEKQNDDTYLSGGVVTIEAPITGDVVVAGGTIMVKDSIYQDLIVAGGDIEVNGYIADDIRAAAGTLVIDGEVGDDVIIAGGQVHITENAIIQGNLVSFSGSVKMDGNVKGNVKSYAGEVTINGSVTKGMYIKGDDITVNGIVNGRSKIIADNILIGETAKFYDDIVYWSDEDKVDFKNSLENVTTKYDETLVPDRNEFSWGGFGLLVVGFWLFYLLSTFLILLLMNWAFGNFFSEAMKKFDKQFLKNLSYGLLYLFGIPLAIVILFAIIIGIPIALLLFGFYVFSILFGHLVTALLLSHYLSDTLEKKWNFWSIIFVALGITVIIRLVTFIPFIGTLISLLVIAIGYGVLIVLFRYRKSLKLT